MLKTFERHLMSGVGRWALYLSIALGIVMTVTFAGAVRHIFVGGTRLHAFSESIILVSELPSNIKKAFSALTHTLGDLEVKERRFGARAGFAASPSFYAAANLGDRQYILVNKFDGDLKHSTSELWDTENGELVHRWNFRGINAIWQESDLRAGNNFKVDAADGRFRNTYALLLEDGSIITHSDSPLIKIDKCSNAEVFQDDFIFHHSVERDESGSYWVPARLKPKRVVLGPDEFSDDALVLVSKSGKILLVQSVAQLLIDNGFGALVFGRGGAFDYDPIHLNDIEPVTNDGPYWRKGDVFLSLRNMSLVMLYRPAKNAVVWFKQGPWLHQHDVNIVSDHEISIFNNNVARVGKRQAVQGVNSVLVYDFKTQKTRSPWQNGFLRSDVRTVTEGRGQPTGDKVFVEESNFGRVIQFSKSGDIDFEYVNRSSSGQLYILNFSRLISRDLGDQVRRVVERSGCP
jgi:hypothetical protein